MKNPSIYIGFVVTSETEDGHLRASTTDALVYQGLDDLQATMIQDVLVREFADDFDELRKKIRPRMIELGYAGALANGAEASEVEALQDMVSGSNGRPSR